MSTPEPNSARTTGARLRAQRDALGLTVSELSRRSGVRPEFITAIERGEAEHLPTTGYALGYVRSLSRELGLDADAMVASYKHEAEGRPARRPRGIPHFVEQRRIRLPRGSVPALGVVAAVVMLGAFYGTQLDTVAAPAPGTVPVPTLGEDTAALVVPDSVLTLQATAPSWVSIRNADGKLIANRVFVTGERWQAQTGQDFTVSVRDGGAVELLVGTRSLGPLGEPGEPVADFALSGVR